MGRNLVMSGMFYKVHVEGCFIFWEGVGYKHRGGNVVVFGVEPMLQASRKRWCQPRVHVGEGFDWGSQTQKCGDV